jgi:hypothetical protein
MKPISFLRTTWRKKDNNSPAKTRPLEQASTEVNIVPTLPKISFGEESILSFHTAQVPVLYPRTQETVPQDERQRMVTENVPASRIRHHTPTTNLRIHGHHGAPFNPSYGPPHDSSHGPPNFILPGRELDSGKDPLSGSSAPRRPPLPPFVNSATVPPSPTRVKFAPVLKTRPPKPGFSTRSSSHCVHPDKINCDCDPVSSGVSLEDASGASDSHESDSCSSQESQSCYSQESALPHSEQYKFLDRALRDHNHNKMQLGPSASFVNTAEQNPPERSAHAAVNRSEPCNPRTLYPVTVSTHLHFTNDGASSSRTKPEPTRNGMISSSPLALFPSPPPLVIRRRLNPLVLPPMPTIEAPLPPSPAFSSTDSTPVATPTTPHSSAPQKPLSPSKITNRRMFYSMPPPTSSAPNTPLPALPVSVPPNHDALAVHPSSWHPRPPRSAQSTVELRPVEKRRPSTSHRTTASAPAPAVSHGRKRANSRPETVTVSSYVVRFFVHSAAPPLIYNQQQSKGRAMPTPGSSANAQVQWGYAV